MTIKTAMCAGFAGGQRRCENHKVDEKRAPQAAPVAGQAWRNPRLGQFMTPALVSNKHPVAAAGGIKLPAAFTAVNGAAGSGRGILRHAEGAAQVITSAPILPAADAALEAPTKSTRSRAAMISMVSRMARS